MYSRILYSRFFLLKIPTFEGSLILNFEKTLPLLHKRAYSSTNGPKTDPNDEKLTETRDISPEKTDQAHSNDHKSSENDDKLDIKRPNDYIHRFSYDKNSDSFFVDRSRLTRGESFYQKFSSGLSFLSVLFLLSFPLALFFFVINNRKQPLAAEPKPDSVPSQKVPVITNSKSLLNLLDSKVPVVIFYYVKSKELPKLLLLSLNRVILTEIGTLFAPNLRVVFVDVNGFKEPINPSLKLELARSGGCLYHLLVPSGNDPMITSLPRLVTVELFVNEIQRVLEPFKFNLGSSNSRFQPNTAKSIDEIDKKLSLLRNCLFDLELNNKAFDALVRQQTLDSMLEQCKRS